VILQTYHISCITEMCPGAATVDWFIDWLFVKLLTRLLFSEISRDHPAKLTH